MEQRSVPRIVDRLNDLLDGGWGVNLEVKEREKLDAMRSNWKKLETILNNLLSRSSAQQTGQINSLSNLMISNAAVKMEELLDKLDEWQIGNILKKDDQLRIRGCCGRHHDFVYETIPSSVREMIGELGGADQKHQQKQPTSCCLSLLGRSSRKPDDIDINVVWRVEEIIAKLEGEFSRQDSHAISAAQNDLVGRDEEFEYLQTLLKSAAKDSVDQVKVVCIVGRDHSGKTAIAQKLYYQPGTTLFDSISWARMQSSSEPGGFKVVEIARRIPETMCNPADVEGISKLEDFECFSNKSFLLIIDGMENVKHSEWMQFLESKITRSGVVLVTTRSEKVAQQICRKEYTFQLHPVSLNGCYEFLTRSLSAEPKVSYPKSKEKILRRIAETQQGFPGYVGNYALLLRHHHPEKWNQLFGPEFSWVSKYWCKELRFIQQLIDAYQKLTPELKRCVASFARFPEHARVTVHQMVSLWMAKGYLHPPPREEGIRCFRELVGYHFVYQIAGPLDDSNYATGYGIADDFPRFALHMAMCDMTWRAQNSFYDQVTASTSEVRDTCLIYSRSDESPPPSFFTHWRYVRFLVLSFCKLENLPNEVESMVLLQYLDLSGNPLSHLPTRKCKWYSLESLDLSFCYMLSCLPIWICELQTLQILRVSHTTDELHNLPKGFEKLSLIRAMDYFTVGGDKYKSNMDKFMSLNKLEQVCLAVHGEVDFSCIDLKSKMSIVTLDLCFTGEARDPEKASSIMKAFKPPQNLETLKLMDYLGHRLPRWIQAKSLVDKLKRLSLKSAVNITCLPALWQLSFLEFLWLYGLLNIKHIRREFFGLPKKRWWQQHYNDISDYSDEDVKVTTESFPCLKTLQIEHMKNLTWEDTEEGEEFDINVMPCLEELINDFDSEDKLPLRILRNTPWFKDVYSNKVKFRYKKSISAKRNDERNTQKKFASAPDDKNEKETEEEYSIKPPPEWTSHPVNVHEKEAEEEYSFKPPPEWTFPPVNVPESYKKEENEKNMVKSPSQTNCDSPSDEDEDLEASRIKLMQLLQDAFTTDPISTLALSFPNTKGTQEFSVEHLHDSVGKKRTTFTEQLFAWSMIVNELVKPSDRNRVQIATSILDSTTGSVKNPGFRSDDLVDFMIENRAELYLVPHHRPGHWELLVIKPASQKVYRFDSLHKSIAGEIEEYLKMVETKYISQNTISAIEHKIWEVVDIKHKRQSGGWECGYYVMIWMRKIALEIKDSDLESHFPRDDHHYTQDELDKVSEEWCEYFLKYMIELPS